MKSITFIGRSSGDMECFCWDDVPEEDMIVVLGKEGYKRDLKMEREWRQDLNDSMGKEVEEVPEKLSRLYPGDILHAIGAMGEGRRYRITVTAEEVEEPPIPMSDEEMQEIMKQEVILVDFNNGFWRDYYLVRTDYPGPDLQRIVEGDARMGTSIDTMMNELVKVRGFNATKKLVASTQCPEEPRDDMPKELPDEYKHLPVVECVCGNY